MAIEFESTYAKAKRDDEGYRKSISSVSTWGEKKHLLPSAPDLCSLVYKGGETLIINFHGGGFCNKHPLDDDALCQYISRTYCVTVLNLDFSSSVKWGYPVQITEIEREIRCFMRSAGNSFKKIIFLGHSSGANLAAVLTRRFLKSGALKVNALILNYPFLDLSIEASKRPEKEGLWPNELLDEWISFYVPNKIIRKDPSISPIYMNKQELKGFPSTYIVAAENDRLTDDALKFAKNLKAARVDTRLFMAPERHGFIEKAMSDIYHLPNDPSVIYAKSIVDQEMVFALTSK